MLGAGFPAGTEYLWLFHYQYYWDFTQRTYREDLDPAYDGALVAGIPSCASGTPGCDADYDLTRRPQAVGDAIARISLTGKIGRPLVTLHGTHEVLLPIGRDSDVYDQMVDTAGAGAKHGYYRVENGTHTDGLYAAFPDRVRPLLPCARSGFAALQAWVDGTAQPPADATLPRPSSGDLVNSCSIG